METKANKDIRIVILQSGWVFVGEYAESEKGITLENAGNIRRWGTNKGLGQLALDGPTSNTIIDQCGSMTAPNCIATIICSSKWQ